MKTAIVLGALLMGGCSVGAAGDRGPAGEQGPAGDEGAPGEKGEPGTAGEDGVDGRDGMPGATGGVRWLDADDVEHITLGSLVADVDGLFWPTDPWTGEALDENPAVLYSANPGCSGPAAFTKNTSPNIAFRVSNTWRVLNDDALPSAMTFTYASFTNVVGACIDAAGTLDPASSGQPIFLVEESTTTQEPTDPLFAAPLRPVPSR